MKEKWIILDQSKSARWWKNSAESKKWTIKSGDDYWIINGSEFPEKKIKKVSGVSHKELGEKSEYFSGRHYLLIFLASLLGISLAMNLILFLK